MSTSPAISSMRLNLQVYLHTMGEKKEKSQITPHRLRSCPDWCKDAPMLYAQPAVARTGGSCMCSSKERGVEGGKGGQSVSSPQALQCLVLLPVF